MNSNDSTADSFDYGTDSTADTFDYGTDGTIFNSIDILIGMMLETDRCPECLQKVEVDYQFFFFFSMSLYL